MKFRKAVGLLILLAGISGCATVPPESVSLSSELGVGIKKQYQSQINLLNIYFESKRKELDAALQRAIALYFSTLVPNVSITLTKEQLGNVSTDIEKLNEKNSSAKAGLEKVRIQLVSKLEENYLTLNQANSTITGLLQSVVSVKESTNKSIQLVSSATGGKIQLDKVFSEVDAFVAKGGSEAGKAINFVEQVQMLIGN